MRPRLIHLGALLLAGLAVSVLTATPAMAQLGKVYGAVTDDEGNPLPGVKIYLKDLKTNAVMRPAVSNKKKGTYLYMAPAGDYMLSAQKEGYLAAREIWEFTDPTGKSNSFTWFYEEDQVFDKKIHVYPEGDLTSKVSQRVDWVMTTPDKHKAVVNRLYREYKGIDTKDEGTGEAAPGGAVVAQSAPEKPQEEEKKSAYESAIDLLGSEKVSEAIPFLNQAVVDEPENAEAYYQLGKADLEVGDTAGAETALLKARELDPTKPGVNFHLARLYDKKSRKVQAVQALEAELNLSPDSEAVLENLGKLYAETGENDKAIQTFESLIDINKKNFDAYIALANIYKETGDRAKEEEIYKKMGDLDPTGQALYNLGTLAFNRDDREKAKFYYERVLEKNPKHAMAHYQLAYTMLGLGDIQGALKHLEEFVRLKPRDAKAAETKATIEALKKTLG